jgi:hypothetical protein
VATKGQKAEFILKISRHQNAKNSAEPTVLLKRVFLQLQFSQIGQVLMQTMMKKSLHAALVTKSWLDKVVKKFVSNFFAYSTKNCTQHIGKVLRVLLFA